MKLLHGLLIATALLVPTLSDAATRYVRAGATGRGDGSDWTNAHTALPASLVRGDTYYVADGTYPGYTFDDPGTTTIVIKKATPTDHGPAADWQSSYGAGQAKFTGGWTFGTGNYTLNGQRRDATNWEQENAYGFDVDGTITISAAGVSNLALSYFSVGGSAGTVWPNVPTYAIKMTVASNPWRQNISFGNCYIHHAEILIHSRENDSVTFDACHIGPGFGKEAISHQTGHAWVIRNNRFIDACVLPANEGCTAVIGMFNFTGGGSPADCKCDRMEIYGNIFAETGKYSAVKADGVVHLNATNYSKFYNNNIVRHFGTQSGAIRLINGVGNEIKNNLWYWVGDYDSGWGGVLAAEANSVSNNWCFYANNKPARLGADCSAIGGLRFNGSEDPFVNRAAGDYRLKASFSGVSPRNSGLALGAAYSVDMNGVQRGGVDGAWDIGALEGVSTTAIQPPSGLQVF